MSKSTYTFTDAISGMPPPVKVARENLGKAPCPVACRRNIWNGDRDVHKRKYSALFDKVSKSNMS